MCWQQSTNFTHRCAIVRLPPDQLMATSRKETVGELPPDSNSVLAALSFPILVIAADDTVQSINGAGEQFFERGASWLVGREIDKIIPSDSPILSLLQQVRASEISIFEYDVELELPRGGGKSLVVSVSPISSGNGSVVLSMHQHHAARSMERQLEYRHAARSVSAMAAMLAHEVKNPLSGIRGAAQLLERLVPGADQGLARLIQEETDRVCDLVDRMDVFADNDLLDRKPVNIHAVLQRVIDSASAGFGRNVKIITDFDPSLPPVLGHRDLLVQVFLNLVKNAVEATIGREREGELILKTGFRRGVSVAAPGGGGRIMLPMLVSVADNGSGIPDDISRHLFDPFITTKTDGSGLGLAFVAKAVDDHGGMIEFDTSAKGTEFRVYLPITDNVDIDEAIL